MDINHLIRSVKVREPLWNRQHPQYKDRELASYLWSQVASEVGVDVESARYKWRGLRDTYRVQLRKIKKPSMKCYNQNLVQSRWEYFHEMTFVKDQIYLDINSKNYRKNKKSEIKYEDSFSFDLDGYEEEGGYYDEGGGGKEYDPSEGEEYPNLGDLCETEMTEGVEILDKDQINKTDVGVGVEAVNGSGSLDGEDVSSRLTGGSDDLDRHFDKSSSLSSGVGQELYPSSLSFMSSHSFEDDNYCFLLSILPQLKSLPLARNLYVRIKMQELLLNEFVSLQSNKKE